MYLIESAPGSIEPGALSYALTVPTLTVPTLTVPTLTVPTLMVCRREIVAPIAQQAVPSVRSS